MTTFFSEIYANIETDENFLNEYKMYLNDNQFLEFKQVIIDYLNKTLLEMELCFDVGKEPALRFTKTMNIFDLFKAQNTISSNDVLKEL